MKIIYILLFLVPNFFIMAGEKGDFVTSTATVAPPCLQTLQCNANGTFLPNNKGTRECIAKVLNLYDVVVGTNTDPKATFLMKLQKSRLKDQLDDVASMCLDLGVNNVLQPKGYQPAQAMLRTQTNSQPICPSDSCVTPIVHMSE